MEDFEGNIILLKRVVCFSSFKATMKTAGILVCMNKKMI